ncbi:MAG: transglycosylase domain-containing protein [Patescibacteria group bacterium]
MLHKLFFKPVHKSASHKHPHRHDSKKRNIKKAARIIISFGLLCAGLVLIWLASLRIPDLSSFQTRKVAQSTKIYDRSGEILLYDIHADAKRTIIPFSEMSLYIKNATLAIEDAEFYNHHGIKPKSIIRAVLANLTPGGLTQGGSTITQQVIKNSILTKDRTITRKIKEWVLAIKLENVLTKEQIFETYLNETPYGGNTYGIEEASKLFFGKKANDVTLAEAAYLAALPQAPSYMSPYGSHKNVLDDRQKLVLRKMKEYNFITNEEFDSASREKVTFLAKNATGIRAPHFSLMIRDYLIEKFGEDVVENDGLKVVTSLDVEMQEKAEKVITNFSKTLQDNFGASNTALVAVDPRNGDLLTMVGSRDYFDKKIEGNYNVATAMRQPGSAFKPFVYATAFNKGYTSETILFDVKTEFSSECNPDSTPKRAGAKCYSPNNYDDIFEGPITIRRALAQSRNIPAVKALYLAGIKDSIRTAESMGITSLTDPDRYGLTLVLGGGEVSLLELTSAYGVFANDGIKNPYRFILKIEDSHGNVLESAVDNPTQALPENSARIVSDILTDKQARFPYINDLLNPIHRDIAVKTGTTNDYRDVWAVGYTPTVAVGAWAGNNDNSPMQRKVAGLIIMPVWAAFMNEIRDKLPDETFKEPDPISSDLKPILRGVWKGGKSYYRDTVSQKTATEFTPAETREEVILNEVHTILYWVDKTDPLGPAPRNPASDSQYNNWETAVRKWFGGWRATNPDFSESDRLIIPNDSDDVHTSKNRPTISITNPDDGENFDEDEMVSISFNYRGNFALKKADFFVNGTYLGSKEDGTTNYVFRISDVPNDGRHIMVKVVAQDAVFNTAEDVVEIDID